MPSPPRQWPTALVKTSTSRRAMPPSTMAMPEKMNRGMARRRYLVMESKVTWVRIDQGRSNTLMMTMDPDRPKTRKMGTEIARVITPRATAR